MKVLNNSQNTSKRVPPMQLRSNGGAEAHTYHFGPFCIDATERSLFDGSRQVSLAPKTFNVLLMLIRNQPRLVTKAQLLNELWPDTFVGEANLSAHIAKLRKVLGDGQGTRRFIETVFKHGYRFKVEVREGENNYPGGESPCDDNGRERLPDTSGVLPSINRAAISAQSPRLTKLIGTIFNNFSGSEHLRVMGYEADLESDLVILICQRQ